MGERALTIERVPVQMFIYFSVLLFPVLIVFVHPWLAFFLALILSLILFFAFHLELGLLLMILLNPFIELQLAWKDWNVPVVDALAIILFLSFCLRLLGEYTPRTPLKGGAQPTTPLEWRRQDYPPLLGEYTPRTPLKGGAQPTTPFEWRRQNFPPLRGGEGGCYTSSPWGRVYFPLLGFFLLFLLSLVPSFLSTPHIVLSLKYLARPLVFFYVIFLLLPVNIVRTKIALLHVAQWSFWAGVIVASMGALSFLSPTSVAGFWPRALPVSFWGFTPLGTNHNLIAETLVSIIPVVGFLMFYEQNFLKKKLYALSLLFFVVISLLTFSRAGWLVLAVEGILLAWVKYKRQWKEFLRLSAALVAIVSFLAIGMYLFHETGQTERSNANRLLLNEIAVSAWKIHPIIGNGLNTFQNFVSENALFTLEFGSALEAHGMIQKLLVETGLMGTLFFFLFLGAIFFSLFKSIRHAPLASPLLFFTVAAFGIFIFELFNTSYFIGKMWLPLGLALAASNLLRDELGEKRVNISLRRGTGTPPLEGILGNFPPQRGHAPPRHAPRV